MARCYGSSDSLRDRFLHAQETFLTLADSDSLDSFSQDWAVLDEDFRRSYDNGEVDDSLRELAQVVAHNIATLGDSLLHLHAETSSLTSSYTSEIETLLSRMSIGEPEHEIPAPRFSQRRTGTLSTPSLPPFIGPAFYWLLRNIHNPYPDRATKKDLAKAAKVSLRTVEDWFKSIRRHIGWVSFYKTHFNGSRSLAVAAARTVHIDLTGNTTDSLVSDLIAVRTRAEMLYLDERGLGHCDRSPRPPPKHSGEFVSSTCTTLRERPHPALDSPPFNLVSVTAEPTSRDSPPARPPSLVFSLSDSEDDEKLPDTPPQAALPAGLGAVSKAHCDVSFAYDDLPSSIDPLNLDPHEFQSLAMSPTSAPRLAISPILTYSFAEYKPLLSSRGQKRRAPDADVYPAMKRPRTLQCRRQGVSSPPTRVELPLPTAQSTGPHNPMGSSFELPAAPASDANPHQHIAVNVAAKDGPSVMALTASKDIFDDARNVEDGLSLDYDSYQYASQRAMFTDTHTSGGVFNDTTSNTPSQAYPNIPSQPFDDFPTPSLVVPPDPPTTLSTEEQATFDFIIQSLNNPSLTSLSDDFSTKFDPSHPASATKRENLLLFHYSNASPFDFGAAFLQPIPF